MLALYVDFVDRVQAFCLFVAGPASQQIRDEAVQQSECDNDYDDQVDNVLDY